MKKLNITKEQFNRSNYFQRKYGKLEYVSESGRLFKTSKGKVLKFVNEGGLRGWELEQDLDSLKEQCEYGNMSFGEVERTLLGLGFKLDEGGSQSGRADDDNQWMVYEHPEGYCVRLTYRFEGRRGSKRASTVMDFDWNADDKIKMKYNESNDQEEFSYKGVVITRYDYESLPMPMAASKLDDETMQKIAEDIYYMLLDHGWEDKDIDRYLGRNLDELEDENDRDANMIKEDFWEYMENAAVANGMEYYSEMEDGDEYMESKKSVKESFGMGFGDRFCDCESDPIEYNGQTYDTWTMYSGDDEVGDVMFADDSLRQDMEENGVDPEIMEMVDLWVNPRDSVEDAIDQIISG